MEGDRSAERTGSATATSPLVCAVVLNWNGWRDTIECLETLRFQTSPVHRLVVVDNGSTDDSLYRVKAWARGEVVLDSQEAQSKHERMPMVLVEYDRLTAEAGGFPEAETRLAAVPPEQRLVLVTIGQNLGFAGGMNVGIRYACALGADYVWLINNDTVVAPDALAALLKAAAGRPRSGLLGPLELDYFKPQRVVDSVGVVRPWRGVIGGAARNLQLNEQGCASAELLSGFCVLARCEAIHAVGFMDDRFFLYCEDTEWCLRMRLRGWDLLHVAAARVWHKGSQSTGWGSPLMYYYTTRNQLRLFTVYFPYAVPAAMARTAGRAVKLAIGGRWRECLAVVRGFGHWIRGRFGRFPEDPYVES